MQRNFIRFAAVLGVLAPGVAHAEDKVDITCYPAWADFDGDNYALDGVSGVTLQRSESQRYTCPSGYVPSGGDCDDNDASIHPNRAEIAFNSVDDDCDGDADNTEYLYFENGIGNGDTSFYIAPKINDFNVAFLAVYGADVYADIRWRSHEENGSSANQTTGKIPISVFQYATPEYGTFWTTVVPLTGLTRATAYRAQVRFYVKQNGSYQRLNFYNNRVYNTVTYDSQSAAGGARTLIALSALKQSNEQELGRVGWNGTVDVNGTRYGAGANEAWCTEFYAWNARNQLDGIVNVSNTTGMRNFFGSDYHAGHSASDLDAARPGDWLGMDTNDDGKKNHSGVFLAHRKDGKVVSVDGNTGGHRVRIKTRDPDAVVGRGTVTSRLLK